MVKPVSVFAGSRRTLIWRLAAQRLLNASSSSSSSDGGDDGGSWTWDEFRPASPLLPVVTYRYRAVCDDDFHGPGCTEFCRPRNDRFGHYDCDVDGTKLCKSGWSGNYCHKRTPSTAVVLSSVLTAAVYGALWRATAVTLRPYSVARLQY